MPTAPDEISNEWLTAALRRSNALDPECTVTGHSTAPVLLQGVTTLVTRIELTYDGAHAEAPRSVIAKLPSPYPEVRRQARERGLYEVEARAYREIGDEIATIGPRAFAVQFDPSTHEFVLLLEDLGDGRAGDPLTFSPRDATMAIPAVAAFHARFTGHPERDYPWLDRPPPYSPDDLHVLAERCAIRFGSDVPATVISASHALADRLELVGAALARRPRTVIHGDLHPQQMFFPGDTGGRFAVFDWQTATIGNGAEDLSRMLTFGLDVRIRRRLERRLIDRYRRELERGGVAIELEDLVADYRLGFGRTLAINVIAASLMDDEQIVAIEERSQALGVDQPLKGFFWNLHAAIEDQRFLDALHELG